jgi:hypothetical protein
MRGIAKNENVLVYSATQTNRSGVKSSGGKPGQEDTAHIDLDKAAESFGKAMPVDYVISLNQTEDEYRKGQRDDKNNKDEDLKPATIRLWIAKNRNGPKFVSITTNVFYDKMVIAEVN